MSQRGNRISDPVKNAWWFTGDIPKPKSADEPTGVVMSRPGKRIHEQIPGALQFTGDMKKHEEPNSTSLAQDLGQAALQAEPHVTQD